MCGVLVCFEIWRLSFGLVWLRLAKLPNNVTEKDIKTEIFTIFVNTEKKLNFRIKLINNGSVMVFWRALIILQESKNLQPLNYYSHIWLQDVVHHAVLEGSTQLYTRYASRLDMLCLTTRGRGRWTLQSAIKPNSYKFPKLSIAITSVFV